MAKTEKTPQERGLTASTDLQVVCRTYEKNRSPAAIRVESIVKQDTVDLKASTSAPQSAGVSMGLRGINSKGQLITYTETFVEYVLQQAWYGPHGDKEWHDISFVDLVPKDIK